MYSKKEIILFAVTHLLMLGFFAFLVFNSSPHDGIVEPTTLSETSFEPGLEAGKK